MRQDLKRRLARAEASFSAMDRADKARADHREVLLALVKVCALIREGLQRMGIDPALAVSLRIGEEAAAELAADEVIVRDDVDGSTGVRGSFEEMIERMAATFRDGSLPNFASASLAELTAFCVASTTSLNHDHRPN